MTKKPELLALRIQSLNAEIDLVNEELASLEPTLRREREQREDDRLHYKYTEALSKRICNFEQYCYRQPRSTWRFSEVQTETLQFLRAIQEIMADVNERRLRPVPAHDRECELELKLNLLISKREQISPIRVSVAGLYGYLRVSTPRARRTLSRFPKTV
jgi:hypothetical protein